MLEVEHLRQLVSTKTEEYEKVCQENDEKEKEIQSYKQLINEERENSNLKLAEAKVCN